MSFWLTEIINRKKAHQNWRQQIMIQIIFKLHTLVSITDRIMKKLFFMFLRNIH